MIYFLKWGNKPNYTERNIKKDLNINYLVINIKSIDTKGRMKDIVKIYFAYVPLNLAMTLKRR